jgi:hypothetical protein
MPAYTPPIGTVWVKDFDRGIVLNLGATLVGNNYFVVFASGLSPNTSLNVPVSFDRPEQVYEQKIYPSYTITRDEPELDLSRWYGVAQVQEMSGVGTPHLVNGVMVYDEVKLAPQAWPYTIKYTISCYARFEYEAQTLLRNLVRRFNPRGYINVIDSLGDTRTYDCFVDAGFTNISDIVDVSERVKAYSINCRVIGELDLAKPMGNTPADNSGTTGDGSVVVDTVQSVEVTVERSYSLK